MRFDWHCGSGPGRLFALFMAETTIITLLAGVIGVGLAELLPALTGISTASPSPDASFASRGNWLQSLDVSLGWRGIAYAAASALLVALVVGLPTAWRAARMPPAHAMASSGLAAGLTASRQRLRLVLVCVQITAAVLLLLGTALAIRQAASDLSTTVLFDTGHVTAARLDLALQGYNETRGRAFYARLTHDVQHMPGVESAAVADGLPGYQYISAPLLKLMPDRDDSGKWDPSHGIDGASVGISRDFFRVVGLQLTRGRLFNPVGRVRRTGRGYCRRARGRAIVAEPRSPRPTVDVRPRQRMANRRRRRVGSNSINGGHAVEMRVVRRLRSVGSDLLADHAGHAAFERAPGPGGCAEIGHSRDRSRYGDF